MTDLRPFFSYFGSKWRIADRYPPPEHDIIVEPFAGSAGYSLHYPDRRVLLIEKDGVVAATWRYLLTVTPQEILSLPLLQVGERVDDLDIPQEAKWLIGWWLNKGTTTPRKQMTTWGDQGGHWGAGIRYRTARQLDYIRHWTVIEGDYRDAPPVTATWFIDPPYQAWGDAYQNGSADLDYPALGGWCRKQSGQVMVCEMEGADWLPFRPLVVERGKRRRTLETVWTNNAST